MKDQRERCDLPRSPDGAEEKRVVSRIGQSHHVVVKQKSEEEHVVDEMAASCNLVSLRCQQRRLRCRKGPESVWTVDVTLQLPYTGRCSLQQEVSSSHANREGGLS